MRSFLITLLIIAVIVIGAVAYLVATTPDRGEPVRFPLSGSHRALLQHVPADAEAFALIPAAAHLHATLEANPVTTEAVAQWSTEHELPRPWMLGAADIVAWKSGKSTSYAVRLDGFRALLVRLWLLVGSNAAARWEGSTLILHAPVAPATHVDLNEVLRLANGLPEGDVFVVQRESARGAFPPIARPAVSSVRVTAEEIVLVSRAAGGDPDAHSSIRAQFPAGALLAASFAAPPRILGDLDRLVGMRLDSLVGDGGSIALYGVDTGTLLPRPRGIIAFPVGDEAREQLEGVRTAAELFGEVREVNGELIVSFDRTSMGLYSKDARVPASWPATRWALRLDAPRLVPVLRKAGDSAGLRFATPRIHRAARDLRHWIDALEKAKTVEAADSVTGGVEELRVRIAAK